MSGTQSRMFVHTVAVVAAIAITATARAQTPSPRAFKGPGWYAMFERDDGGYDWPGAEGEAGPYKDTDSCFAAAKKLEEADRKSSRAKPRLANCMLLEK